MALGYMVYIISAYTYPYIGGLTLKVVKIIPICSQQGPYIDTTRTLLFAMNLKKHGKKQDLCCKMSEIVSTQVFPVVTCRYWKSYYRL